MAQRGVLQGVEEFDSGVGPTLPAWQRCRMHFMRNALARAGKTQRCMVSAAIGTVFVQDSHEATRSGAPSPINFVGNSPSKLGALMGEAEHDVTFRVCGPESKCNDLNYSP